MYAKAGAAFTQLLVYNVSCCLLALATALAPPCPPPLSAVTTSSSQITPSLQLRSRLMILTKRPYLDACRGRAEKNVLHVEEKEEFALIKGPMLAASLQILCFTSFHLAFRQKQTIGAWGTWSIGPLFASSRKSTGF